MTEIPFENLTDKTYAESVAENPDYRYWVKEDPAEFTQGLTNQQMSEVAKAVRAEVPRQASPIIPIMRQRNEVLLRKTIEAGGRVPQVVQDLIELVLADENPGESEAAKLVLGKHLLEIVPEAWNTVHNVLYNMAFLEDKLREENVDPEMVAYTIAHATQSLTDVVKVLSRTLAATAATLCAAAAPDDGSIEPSEAQSLFLQRLTLAIDQGFIFLFIARGNADKSFEEKEQWFLEHMYDDPKTYDPDGFLRELLDSILKAAGEDATIEIETDGEVNIVNARTRGGEADAGSETKDGDSKPSGDYQA